MEEWKKNGGMEKKWKNGIKMEKWNKNGKIELKF